MKSKTGFLAAASLIAGLSLAPQGAKAQTTAYTTSFTTSITYQNVGTGTAQVSLQFFNESNGAAIPVSRPDLPQNAGTSIFVGNLSSPAAGFKGSAVLSANQPIVATVVQVPPAGAVKNRPLSNGFSDTSGSDFVLIATVLNARFNYTTQFSVQNIDTVGADITVRFFNADANGAEMTAAKQVITNLPSGAAKYIDAGKVGLPANFNGSATITAVKTGTTTAGKVVAAAMELQTNGIGASSFEGVTGGANTVFMPSALCNAFGGTNTSYAVQNTSNTSAANVEVLYSNGTKSTATINPGAKASFQGCAATGGSGSNQGYSGSATITSTGAPIVAIGKVGGLGFTTAFLGATSGAPKLALPYVRWSQTQYESGGRQRAFIAIQNVGTALTAGQVSVKYLDKNGNIVGTHSIDTGLATGGKANSDPSKIGAPGAEFGFYTDGTFGGSAIVEGPVGSQLVAVVRIQSRNTATSPTSTVGEDYNGIPVQ